MATHEDNAVNRQVDDRTRKTMRVDDDVVSVEGALAAHSFAPNSDDDDGNDSDDQAERIAESSGSFAR